MNMKNTGIPQIAIICIALSACTACGGQKNIAEPVIETAGRSELQEELPETEDDAKQDQEEVFKNKVLNACNMEEDAILMMDYDDYDHDGTYEAFVMCGESMETEYEPPYEGTLWFVTEDECIELKSGCYRMIDGKMKFDSGRKYLYFYSDMYATANISELWTVENGKPTESEYSQVGEVIYRGGDDFEIWIDAYDYCHEVDEDADFWTGHTWKPYFFHYDKNADKIEAYMGEVISEEELAEVCEWDLAAEIEAEGYELGTIIRWGPRIVTVNYATIPKEGYTGTTFENIIWDCQEKDYWRSEERGVTSWKDAGYGGSYLLEAVIL